MKASVFDKYIADRGAHVANSFWPRAKKRIGWTLLAFGALLAVVFAGRAAAGWFDDWRYAMQVRQLVALARVDGPATVAARVDQLRQFVNDHSIHLIDGKFKKDWQDRKNFSRQMIDYAQSRDAGPPHMECSTRSSLLAAMLNQLGYKTRRIDLYNGAKTGPLVSHSFVDVFNPETGRWETVDADFDVFWLSKKTGQRVSVFDKAHDLEDLVPCGRRQCGWHVMSRERIRVAVLSDYLGFMTARDHTAGKRLTVYTKRVAPDQIHRLRTRDGGMKVGTFCHILAKNCRDGFIAAQQSNGVIIN